MVRHSKFWKQRRDVTEAQIADAITLHKGRPPSSPSRDVPQLGPHLLHQNVPGTRASEEQVSWKPLAMFALAALLVTANLGSASALPVAESLPSTASTAGGELPQKLPDWKSLLKPEWRAALRTDEKAAWRRVPKSVLKRLRGVAADLADLQQDVYDEDWQNLAIYPNLFQAYLPVFTRYTDSAFPSSSAVDESLRFSLRYEVGAFYRHLRELEKAVEEKSLPGAEEASALMSLSYDRYLKAGDLYEGYDEDRGTNPKEIMSLDQIEFDAWKGRIMEPPALEPPLVRDEVVILVGPDKGKTGRVLWVARVDGKAKFAIVKLSYNKVLQDSEVKTFSYSWIARTSSSGDQLSKDALCGFVAAVVACSVVYPIDSTKVRLQTGRSAMPSDKEGGFLALYDGLLLNLGREAPNAAMLLAIFNFLKRAIFNWVLLLLNGSLANVTFLRFAAMVPAGAIADAVGSTVRVPFELMNKQVQAGNAKNFSEAFDEFTPLYLEPLGFNLFAQRLVWGFLAGFFAGALTVPVDNISTTVMTEARPRPLGVQDDDSSVFDLVKGAASRIWATKGLEGFFVGGAERAIYYAPVACKPKAACLRIAHEAAKKKESTSEVKAVGAVAAYIDISDDYITEPDKEAATKKLKTADGRSMPSAKPPSRIRIAHILLKCQPASGPAPSDPQARRQAPSDRTQGYAGGPCHPGSSNLFDLHVQCMTGEEWILKVSPAMWGQEIRHMVSMVASKRGAKLTLYHGTSALVMDQTLQEQGIVSEVTSLSCTYMPANLHAAWCFIRGLATSEEAFGGLTRLTLKVPGHHLLHLPESLESLTVEFNPTHRLRAMQMPAGLQTLTFGRDFDLSLERVTLPASLQTLTFGSCFNQSLERVTLPPNLKSLTFGRDFNKSLDRVTLPPALQALTFDVGFNQSLERVTLPPRLQDLTLGWCFNQNMERVTLPPSLQTLTFGHSFRFSLERVTLPPSLQKLTLGWCFNQSLERVTLPPSLQTLTFDANYNQSLEHVSLPPSLQMLTFGERFYQSLERVTLPPGLQMLTICHLFNRLERVILPQSLQTLTFGCGFCQSLERVTLPTSLQTLTFGRDFDLSLEQVTLPASLQTLTFGSCFNQSLERVTLPPNLKSLTFGRDFNQSLDRVTLPPALQTLSFGGDGDFDQSLERATLPPSLETLTFGWCFNQSLERVTLPPNLKSLTFGRGFNQSLDRVTLPPTLQALTFDVDFNQSLERVTLPPGLQTLTFGWSFNQSLERVTLPPSLQTLTFGRNFNQSLEHASLPPGLQTLILGERFNQNLERACLPPNLQTLTFGHDFNQSLKSVIFPHKLEALFFDRGFQQGLEGVDLPISLKTLGLPEAADGEAQLLKLVEVLLAEYHKGPEAGASKRLSAKFAELAREHSDCKSATSGALSDLGWINQGQHGKDFDAVAFELPVGGLSDIIVTQRGVDDLKWRSISYIVLHSLAPNSAMLRGEVSDWRTRHGEIVHFTDFPLSLLLHGPGGAIFRGSVARRPSRPRRPAAAWEVTAVVGRRWQLRGEDGAVWMAERDQFQAPLRSYLIDGIHREKCRGNHQQ
eukprot:s11_g11.t3